MTGAGVGPSALRIALLYPDLLGTYGDGGNAVVLARRAAWRGIPAEVVEVAAGDPVPGTCDLYLVGGGEDGPQGQAARDIGVDGPLHRAVEEGAVALAVCAGLQIAGTEFPGPDGLARPGLGLLDCVTVRTDEPRAVGELVVDADDPLGLGRLTGFENHGGRTRLGPTASPLGRVVAGIGNGVDPARPDAPRAEGAVAHRGRGHVVGTYLHGPVLARNPALADRLLAWVVDAPLEPLDDAEVEALRRQRFRAVEAGRLDGVASRTWRDRLLRRN